MRLRVLACAAAFALSAQAGLAADDGLLALHVEMQDGTEVAADIIVSATGLNLSVMGGIPFSVNGAPHDFSQSFAHRGILFTGKCF